MPSPTTTVPPTTTTTAPTLAATGGSVHYGQVTYYAHPAGTCASPFLPFGTVVRVTNPANGASVTCLVNDREADTARSIDLATATFAQLGPAVPRGHRRRAELVSTDPGPSRRRRAAPWPAGALAGRAR